MIDAGLNDYAALLGEVKSRIAGARVRAALAASRELLRLYWEIGRLIGERQASEGWGAGVIPRLAADLARELPESTGFSERNLKRMLRFAREYPALQPAGSAESSGAVPQAVAHRADAAPFWSLPWGHHVLLFERVPNATERTWYMDAAVAEGWSRDALGLIRRTGGPAPP